MECPECKYKFQEMLDECQYEVINSGSGYNYEFGQKESWFSCEVICSECGHKFDYSDSSL